jgi:sugar O-acyltransferase (sialic acid O-acetyltransferase NeuD family)
MAEDIGIVGGGGHGRVVADIVRAAGHRVAGYIDADPRKLGMVVEPGGGTVLMGQAEFLARLGSGAGLPAGLTRLAVGVGDNHARLELLEVLERSYLSPLVHPAATVSPSAVLGAGTVVFAAAVVNASAVLARGVIVNSGAIVEHDCVLEDAVHVSPGAVLAGGVIVRARGWIGAGATVLPGVTIGADAVVGAGAVCLTDVPPRATVVGNPARAIKRRSS